jgi:hypothetical protein
MKAIERDPLVNCLEQRLTLVKPNESPELFIEGVAEAYLLSLIKQAHVPMRYLETLKEEVRVEILDLLRIRSYKSGSLEEYLNQCAEAFKKVV